MAHPNSIKALEEITDDGSKEARKKAIKIVLANSSKYMRDYDVLQVLFPGSSDMNLVRPRITEMHKAGTLIEGPKATSHMRSTPVRTSDLVNKQLTLNL